MCKQLGKNQVWSSPKATTTPGASAVKKLSSKFTSVQMTPNPLIKNSFASPIKAEQPAAQASEFLATFNETYSTIRSSTKKTRQQHMNETSGHSGKNNALGSAIMAIPIQKIDISQFSNQMEHVPKIKGIKK